MNSQMKKSARNGMSLMEVLASTFVISVGLLGVLAVIPFGAFQISKARDAEHTANMLNAAAKDTAIMGITRPLRWLENTAVGGEIANNSGVRIAKRTGDTDFDLRYGRFYLVDPFGSTNAIEKTGHIYQVGFNFLNNRIWREMMTGQDDLLYTRHGDKRTDFSGTGNNVVSSGKYTWLVMFQPAVKTGTNPTYGSYTSSTTLDPELKSVDLVGCYNRVPDDERIVYARIDKASGSTNNDVVAYLSGASIKLRADTKEALDLSSTKYLFVSWPMHTTSPEELRYGGAWCKVVNMSDVEMESVTISDNESNAPALSATQMDYVREVFVTGINTDAIPVKSNETLLRVLNIPGVIYHKNVTSGINLY